MRGTTESGWGSSSSSCTSASSLMYTPLLRRQRRSRRARRLVSQRLDEWGHPYDGPANETVTLIAAELASNAVRHGHVAGRDFPLRLTASDDALRLEVSDTRSERLPEVREPSGESGRGLLLVGALADKWGSRRGSRARPSGPRYGRVPPPSGDGTHRT
ncbi:ATP-binding protein [Streptomyces sp. WELS2]|uniref:ATP-binding protein n=1 Tax=Streptomyces sp. WELS2 TaxID=2749435 RepID=UPI002867BCD4|nr:ATP-binding protein [Streptomyces sp. WELS2]